MTKIAILRIGTVDRDVIDEIKSSLCKVFPKTDCVILENVMLVSQDKPFFLPVSKTIVFMGLFIRVFA